MDTPDWVLLGISIALVVLMVIFVFVWTYHPNVRQYMSSEHDPTFHDAEWSYDLSASHLEHHQERHRRKPERNEEEELLSKNEFSNVSDTRTDEIKKTLF